MPGGQTVPVGQGWRAAGREMHPLDAEMPNNSTTHASIERSAVVIIPPISSRGGFHAAFRPIPDAAKLVVPASVVAKSFKRRLSLHRCRTGGRPTMNFTNARVLGSKITCNLHLSDVSDGVTKQEN